MFFTVLIINWPDTCPQRVYQGLIESVPNPELKHQHFSQSDQLLGPHGDVGGNQTNQRKYFAFTKTRFFCDRQIPKIVKESWSIATPHIDIPAS